MIDARILGHGQVRTKRQFLEYATDTKLQSAGGRIIPLRLARHGHLPAARASAIPANTFISVDLPALWPTRPSFSVDDGEIYTVQSTDDAEHFSTPLRLTMR